MLRKVFITSILIIFGFSSLAFAKTYLRFKGEGLFTTDLQYETPELGDTPPVLRDAWSIWNDGKLYLKNSALMLRLIGWVDVEDIFSAEVQLDSNPLYSYKLEQGNYTIINKWFLISSFNATFKDNNFTFKGFYHSRTLRTTDPMNIASVFNDYYFLSSFFTINRAIVTQVEKHTVTIPRFLTPVSFFDPEPTDDNDEVYVVNEVYDESLKALDYGGKSFLGVSGRYYDGLLDINAILASDRFNNGNLYLILQTGGTPILSLGTDIPTTFGLISLIRTSTNTYDSQFYTYAYRFDGKLQLPPPTTAMDLYPGAYFSIGLPQLGYVFAEGLLFMGAGETKKPANTDYKKFGFLGFGGVRLELIPGSIIQLEGLYRTFQDSSNTVSIISNNRIEAGLKLKSDYDVTILPDSYTTLLAEAKYYTETGSSIFLLDPTQNKENGLYARLHSYISLLETFGIYFMGEYQNISWETNGSYNTVEGRLFVSYSFGKVKGIILEKFQDITMKLGARIKYYDLDIPSMTFDVKTTYVNPLLEIVGDFGKGSYMKLSAGLGVSPVDKLLDLDMGTGLESRIALYPSIRQENWYNNVYYNYDGKGYVVGENYAMLPTISLQVYIKI